MGLVNYKAPESGKLPESSPMPDPNPKGVVIPPPPVQPVDPMIGRWIWTQLGVAHPNNPKSINNDVPSNAMGILDVKPDGTFWIWNTIKHGLKTCYKVEEAEGLWSKRIGKGAYKFEYGPYFYIVAIKPSVGIGSFIAMSNNDQWDIGYCEYGILMKSTDAQGNEEINIAEFFAYFPTIKCKE